MFSRMTWYLFSVRHSHLAFSVSIWLFTLYFSFSQNFHSLVVLPILSALLLAKQCFIKLILVTKLYSVQERYPMAFPLFSFQNKNFESNLLCLAFFLTISHSNM